MQVSRSDDRILKLFLPHPRLRKINNLYQYVDAYIDLSKYKFNEQEKDFLCECIYSKDTSVIGVTSKNGKPRITIHGIHKRYKINKEMLSEWLETYRSRQIQNVIDIINAPPESHSQDDKLRIQLKRKAIELDEDINAIIIKHEQVKEQE